MNLLLRFKIAFGILTGQIPFALSGSEQDNEEKENEQAGDGPDFQAVETRSIERDDPRYYESSSLFNYNPVVQAKVPFGFVPNERNAHLKRGN